MSNKIAVHLDTLKFIPKEHTVPLRVDDRVRVLNTHTGYLLGEEGVITEINSESVYPYRVKVDTYRYSVFQLKDLELIPTEKDITVGSVWEGEEDGQVTIIEIDTQKTFPVKFSSNKGYNGAWELSTFGDTYKLIHRGDEVVEEEYTSINFTPLHTGRLNVTITTEKQTNKKEKKMKRAEKVAKVGMLVVDRDCNNSGKIDVVYPETGQVIYIDQRDGSIHLVDIDRLFIPVVMPKPKPVKGKKKVKK